MKELADYLFNENWKSLIITGFIVFIVMPITIIHHYIGAKINDKHSKNELQN